MFDERTTFTRSATDPALLNQVGADRRRRRSADGPVTTGLGRSHVPSISPPSRRLAPRRGHPGCRAPAPSSRPQATAYRRHAKARTCARQDWLSFRSSVSSSLQESTRRRFRKAVFGRARPVKLAAYGVPSPTAQNWHNTGLRSAISSGPDRPPRRATPASIRLTNRQFRGAIEPGSVTVRDSRRVRRRRVRTGAPPIRL